MGNTMIEKIDMLGVGISAIKMDNVLQQMEHWIKTGEQNYICVCPNHPIIESQKDKELRRILNSAGLTTPDGMSVVWACKFYGYSNVERVYGPDLMLNFSAIAAERGYTNFYFGGSNEVPEELAERLCQRFPGLKVAGTYSPPFRPLTPEEDEDIVETINQADPDVVWVGLGAPKQDLWMGEHIGRINAPVMVGVGAAFDFLSGRKEWAPKWVQRTGLEWLFRLVREPRRLWRRNLYHPLFAYNVLLQRMGIKRFDLEQDEIGLDGVHRVTPD